MGKEEGIMVHMEKDRMVCVRREWEEKGLGEFVEDGHQQLL